MHPQIKTRGFSGWPYNLFDREPVAENLTSILVGWAPAVRCCRCAPGAVTFIEAALLPFAVLSQRPFSHPGHVSVRRCGVVVQGARCRGVVSF